MGLRSFLRRITGRIPSRDPDPIRVDPDYYRSCYQAAMRQGETPAAHFEREGRFRGFKPNADFDPLVHALQTGTPPAEATGHATRHGQRPGPGLKALLSGLRVRGVEEVSVKDPRLHPRRGEIEVRRNNEAAVTYDAGYETTIDGTSLPYTVSAPPSARFFEELANRPNFTFVKLPHGFWDYEQVARRIAVKLSDDPRLKGWSEEMRLRISRRRAALVHPHVGNYAEYFTDEVLQDAASGIWDDPELRIGLGFKGFPTWDNRLWPSSDHDPDAIRRRIARLEQLFPEGRDFWDGTYFKRLAITGHLFELPERLEFRPGLLLGSDFVADLPARLNWPALRHLEIAPRNTHWTRYELLDGCRDVLRDLCAETAHPVFLSRAGGSLMFWLIPRLRREFPQVAYLDLGTSMDIWLADRTAIVGWIKIYWPTLTMVPAINAYYNRLGLGDLASLEGSETA